MLLHINGQWHQKDSNHPHVRQKNGRPKVSKHGKIAGFQAAMDELLEENVNIKEVMTDAHLGIGSIMSKLAE